MMRPDPCIALMAEIYAALKQGHVEEHLRPRAALRITKAYEQYWKDCGAVDDSKYEQHTAAAARAAERQGKEGST